MDHSRRDFVQRICLFGAASTVLSSCGGGETPPDTSSEEEEAVLTCTDTSGLSEQDATLRATLNYVDISTVEGKTCDNCALYVAPEAGSGCGTCLTVKGPIHPLGYCDIWAALTA